MDRDRDRERERERRAGGDLAALTAAKTVINGALRWVPPFLPTIGRGLGVSVGTMATLVSLGELTGLSALAVGRRVARDGERRWLLTGLALCSAGCLVAAALARPVVFLAGYAMLTLGVSMYTTSGHLWLGRRFPFSARGRAMATFEISWAVGILLGAPLAGLAVARLGWRAPLVGFAVVSALAGLAVARRLRSAPSPLGPGTGAGAAAGGARAAASTAQPARYGRAPRRPARQPPLPGHARAVIAAVVSMWFASLSVFVVYGAWFEDAFGFGAVTIGATAVLLGATELAASGSAIVLTDRWGPIRSARRGLVGMGASVALVAGAGGNAVVGVAALVLFLGTFEFAFVSAMALVTEADQGFRGRVVGATHSLGTLTRAAGAFTGGWIYERAGMATVSAVTTAGIVASLAALGLRSGRAGSGGARPGSASP